MHTIWRQAARLPFTIVTSCKMSNDVKWQMAEMSRIAGFTCATGMKHDELGAEVLCTACLQAEGNREAPFMHKSIRGDHVFGQGILFRWPAHFVPEV